MGVQKESIKKPRDVFKKCPRCSRGPLITFDDDVLCPACPWDSISQYSDALFDHRVGPLFALPTASPLLVVV